MNITDISKLSNQIKSNQIKSIQIKSIIYTLEDLK